MKDQIKQAVISHLEGMINKHKMNLQLMLNNPVAVAEHPDFLETFEGELEKVAHYEDMLKVTMGL